MVVCGGMWWFEVVCGGLWWFMVVCGGLLWFVMVCGVLSYTSYRLPLKTHVRALHFLYLTIYFCIFGWL